MKLYLLVNNNGNIHDIAFTHEEAAIRCSANYINQEWNVQQIELDYVGKFVYYCCGYYGFDYDFRNSKIYDVTKVSKIFSNIRECKNCDIWQNALNSTKNKMVGEYEIRAIDQFGDPFIYGDVMEGMFNIRIHKIRVYKYN